MNKNFNKCLSMHLVHEDGYVNHPKRTDKLNKNLGLYPAEAAMKILDDVNARASSPYIGMTYVKPYVDRLLQQQRDD